MSLLSYYIPAINFTWLDKDSMIQGIVDSWCSKPIKIHRLVDKWLLRGMITSRAPYVGMVRIKAYAATKGRLNVAIGR